ncbi:RNase H domain-containing protein [Trichonephila clavipes]|nr:RNase H domain-containing protein [Trichonephila clavipes]
MRFEVNSYGYFNKIKSFGSFNRTSSSIINWSSNQRLKRDGPLNYMRKHGFINFNVDTSTPFSCITPIDSFNHVEFREELLTSTPKHSSHPELLRQLALEVINDIPDQALIIYTDRSRSDTGRAGSGIFSNTPGNDVKISIRNTDHCFVFRLELIAIRGALDHALNSYKDSIWILTDSRSSIQYLKNWPKIMDSTGLDNLSKLVRLGQRKHVCLHWIPSHVGEPGNEAADERAAKSPGLSIQCRSSRAHQTALTRLTSDHLRSMTFVQGLKSFFTCPCSLLASPTHLLDCWGISLRQLYEEQDLVCGIDRVEDDEPAGRPRSAITDHNIAQIRDMSVFPLTLVLNLAEREPILPQLKRFSQKRRIA